jgi:hypothetical protein
VGRKGIIRFRCWYCNRKHVAGWDQAGERRVCQCGERYRVPRQPGLALRDKTPIDWLVGFVVYGGGCALMGLGLGLLLASKLFFRRLFFWESLVMVGGLTVAGLLIGGLFGERGVNWIGSYIRSAEDPD